jgi:hypothetical protein
VQVEARLERIEWKSKGSELTYPRSQGGSLKTGLIETVAAQPPLTAATAAGDTVPCCAWIFSPHMIFNMKAGLQDADSEWQAAFLFAGNSHCHAGRRPYSL